MFRSPPEYEVVRVREELLSEKYEARVADEDWEEWMLVWSSDVLEFEDESPEA